jgi:hypothetical protein
VIVRLLLNVLNHRLDSILICSEDPCRSIAARKTVKHVQLLFHVIRVLMDMLISRGLVPRAPLAPVVPASKGRLSVPHVLQAV